MKKLLLPALFALACSLPATAQQKLKVAYEESGKMYQPLLMAIYKEAGLEPEFVMLPFERSLRSVDSGEVDADIGRVAGGIADYPNLVETTVAVVEIKLNAVVKKDFKAAKVGIPDLKQYKLGHVRGAKIAEGIVKKVGASADNANNLQALLQMLNNDRFEVALIPSTTPIASYPELTANLKTLPDPVFTSKVVHVLNKKWAHLVPKIDAAIKAMIADGRMAKMMAPPR